MLGIEVSTPPPSPDEAGATMVEYALLVALIAVVALVGIALAGDSISETFSNVANSLSTASN